MSETTIISSYSSTRYSSKPSDFSYGKDVDIINIEYTDNRVGFIRMVHVRGADNFRFIMFDENFFPVIDRHIDMETGSAMMRAIEMMMRLEWDQPKS